VLLAVDIGNTNIVLGIFQGERLVASWRTATAAHRMPDEYAMLLDNLCRYQGLSLRDVRHVVLCSVVPALTTTFSELAERYLGVSALRIGPEVKTGIRIDIDNPREVGADRLVDAVAAYHRYGGPTIVLDFGTATTLDAITADGAYVGGAIAPGITISADALFARAARLYRVEMVAPSHAIGRNTVDSMQSGIIFGYVGLVEGLVARFKNELGPSKVVATGGLAPVICRETRVVDEVVPELTLEGLRMVYALNRSVS
jgi:type III pantothenate kinase